MESKCRLYTGSVHKNIYMTLKNAVAAEFFVSRVPNKRHLKGILGSRSVINIAPAVIIRSWISWLHKGSHRVLPSSLPVADERRREFSKPRAADQTSAPERLPVKFYKEIQCLKKDMRLLGRRWW